jgi:pimeloyl-ACP methyl ester carboxylesterase
VGISSYYFTHTTLLTKRLFFILLLLMGAYIFYTPGRGVHYGNSKAAGRYYNIRGFKMYCEAYGRGKPLIMIHGNNGSIATFAAIIPYFSQKYRVILADSRAQGKSVDNKDSLTFEMMADDESALMDSLHIDSAYVLGWSDGGVVALLMAIRHPQKVIKLAASGANLRPDSSAIDPELWKSQKHTYNLSKNKVLTTEVEKNKWKIFLLDWLQPNIPLKAIRTIQCPSFIIGGDHDLIPVKHTIQISQNIPNSKLWIVPNSGHATLIEHTADFDKKVDDFFNPPYKH